MRTARVGLVLGVVLFAGMLLVPGPAGLTASAQRMAAVALLMATWWVTQAIPLAATALLPLVTLPLLGIMPGPRVAAQYGDHNVFLFMGGFLIALAMERWGLHRRLAAWTLLLFGASLRTMVLGFMVATALLSMWISNTATTMLMLPIALATLSRFQDLEEADNLGVALLLGIAYAASVGGLGTLIGTPPNIVLAGAVRRLLPGSPELGFGQWMLVGVPLVAVFLPLIWLYVVRVGAPLPRGAGRAGAGALRQSLRQDLRDLGPMARGEWIVLTVFVLAAAAWILRRPLLQQLAPQLTDTTIAMGAALLLFGLPVDWRRGEFALDWEQAKKLPWGVLILFGGGFALAAGMQASGLSAWLGGVLGRGVAPLPLPVAILILCVFMVLLTEVTSNTAITTTMMPILAATFLGAGRDALLFMAPAAMAASCAFLLPVATPPNAIVFGTGRIPLGRMIRIGLWLELFGVLLITLLMSTIGRAVLGR